MKILVIEDDAPIRDTLRDMLEISGYDVITARDGVEGLEQLPQKPDLILCDLAMPRMDGFEVLTQVRRDKKLGPIPFIVLTAKTERSDLRRAMELGADDYITKPFTSKEVLAAIEARVQRTKPLLERLEEYKEMHENQIAASWGHELLTPLNGILGGAEVLLSEAETLNPNDIREIGAIIQRAGKRELVLAKKILFHFDLERLALNGTKVPFQTLEAGPIIREISVRVCRDADRLRDLVMDLGPGKVQLALDWLTIAVEELIDNAIKFSQVGTPIKVKGSQDNGFYKVEIINSGVTMSPEQVEAIGPFIQFDRDRKEQQGLGLGLSNVIKMTSLIKGKLEIQPAPDSPGVLARFSIPAP